MSTRTTTTIGGCASCLFLRARRSKIRLHIDADLDDGDARVELILALGEHPRVFTRKPRSSGAPACARWSVEPFQTRARTNAWHFQGASGRSIIAMFTPSGVGARNGLRTASRRASRIYHARRTTLTQWLRPDRVTRISGGCGASGVRLLLASSGWSNQSIGNTRVPVRRHPPDAISTSSQCHECRVECSVIGPVVWVHQSDSPASRAARHHEPRTS
jgi:hypothetical protein